MLGYSCESPLMSTLLGHTLSSGATTTSQWTANSNIIEFRNSRRHKLLKHLGLHDQ